MKLFFFYRITLIAAFAVISPLTLMALERGVDKSIRRDLAEYSLSGFQDSSARRKTDNKRDQGEKIPQDVQDERLKEAQRRAVKQVPRSAPKLKPQPVSRGVRVRQPIKIPKKGLGGLKF